jgi:O-antigen ligase
MQSKIQQVPGNITWAGLLSFLTGFSAFFPIGIVYLIWLSFAVIITTLPNNRKQLKTVLHHPVTIIILIPIGLAAISTFIHGLHEQTATRLFHTFRNGAIIFCGLIISQRQRDLVLRGVLFGALYAVSIIFIHHFVIDLPLLSPYDDLLRTQGNAGSQKMILLATTGGLAFWLALCSNNQRERFFYLLFWAITSVTVATHAISRNAYLITLILPAFALLYRFRQPKGIAIASLLFTALLSIVWFGSETVRTRTHQAISELRLLHDEGIYNGSTNARAQMMLEASKQMMQHPLFGTGTGSWLEHWRIVARNTPEVAEINNPHNDYLLAGMENGIPGLLALLGMMTAFLYINWKANDRWGGLAFLVTASVGITAAINAPFRDAVLGMALVWLMAAFTRLSISQTTSGNDIRPRPRGQ